MMDDLDRIMAVMTAAFDPRFGEAWTRIQVENALLLPTTHSLLVGPSGTPPQDEEVAVGFTLSRAIAGEEELLLFAVTPAARGRGIGTQLLRRFVKMAELRGSERIFLEMREGNPAGKIYINAGFTEVGRRKNYYRLGTVGPRDAITLSKPI